MARRRRHSALGSRQRPVPCHRHRLFAMLPLRPRGGHAVEDQVFFIDPRVSDEAVLSVAIEAAGLANNVNYSEAAIMASLGEVAVAHTDAGANWALARAPAILRRDGVRVGFGAAQL